MEVVGLSRSQKRWTWLLETLRGCWQVIRAGTNRDL